VLGDVSFNKQEQDMIKFKDISIEKDAARMLKIKANLYEFLVESLRSDTNTEEIDWLFFGSEADTDIVITLSFDVWHLCCMTVKTSGDWRHKFREKFQGRTSLNSDVMEVIPVLNGLLMMTPMGLMK
jgi:hypothetical protein